jgi:hypothetical protein
MPALRRHVRMPGTRVTPANGICCGGSEAFRHGSAKGKNARVDVLPLSMVARVADRAGVHVDGLARISLAAQSRR